jgi:hypothetical protein
MINPYGRSMPQRFRHSVRNEHYGDRPFADGCLEAEIARLV